MRAPAIKYCFESAVAITLRFQLLYVQPVTQRYRRKTVEEVPLQQFRTPRNTMIRVPSTINYCLESAAAIALRFQLCSTRYTALQAKNSVRIVYAISPVTTVNTDNSHLQTYSREATHRTSANRHLGLSAKRNGTQRRTKVSP